MTKGGHNKPTMLGRLIFGEKRKQHASPSRHRSVVRNGTSLADVSSSPGDITHKNAINVHDWAAWRIQLNEQMSKRVTERADIKQMRQFLQTNPFYQQHSRDLSGGRHNGVRLLFSIPHAKLKSDLINGSQGELNRSTNIQAEDKITSNPTTVQSNIDDHMPTKINLPSVRSPLITNKTISQLVSRGLTGHTGDFLHVNEEMIAADGAQTHRSICSPFGASDRVHSTLQKAVKDGNVLEKIKAFEMQAAAAQADSSTKLGSTSGINTRLQSTTSTIPSGPHRTLSPAMRRPMQQPISPIIMQREPQQQHQQYIRSHRNRHVHPAQHFRDGNLGPMISRESRKGAHVLEPAHGDIILKRRTPSQKTANDDDYTFTAMSSLAHTVSQGHQHHRTTASHSRHRQEMVYDKRTSNNHDTTHKKHQSKQKESTTSPPPPAKTNTRRRWLKGRKETPTETVRENVKQDLVATKSKKTTKNKKKTSEQDKLELIRKATSSIPVEKTLSSDNNRVYGVPNTIIDEQTKLETTSSPVTSRIDEENESDQDEKTLESKHDHMSPKEDDSTQSKACNTTVERRPSKTKYHKKLSSTDGEILSKVEDDTRFSRPTDDHAHRSELNDEDDECRSEGDVFIEDLSTTNLNPHQQRSSPSNIIQRQGSVDDILSDRRWQWSKESGGLIDKGSRKKKQQSPITIVTRKNKINQDEKQVVHETSQSSTHPTKRKQSSHAITATTSGTESENTKQISKQILHAIMSTMNTTNDNQGQSTTDDFFEIGPHTNPEVAIINMTGSS